MPIESNYDRFNPLEYLRNYYTRTHLSSDEVAIFETLIDWLRSLNRTFAMAIDVGCGPTLHHSFAVTPFVKRLDLADYLPSNRTTIRDWLQASPTSHDWAPLFREVLRIEDANKVDIEKRTALYRSRVGEIMHCDLLSRAPFAQAASSECARLSMHYDLVLSFFCAECVAREKLEWEVVTARILNLAKVGGAVFLAACGGCDRYRVLGHWFPGVSITVRDLTNVMLKHGFDPTTVIVESVPAPEFIADGFDHILMARGLKRSE